MKKRRREELIEKIKNGIAMPRLQISVILAITALVGFVTSFILLKTGVTSMALRYPLAVFAAYIGFLMLLRVWLWWQSDEPAGSFDVGNVVISDISVPDIGSGDAASHAVFGGGGDFAGGGSGGDWSGGDVPKPVPVAFASHPAPTATPLSSASSSSSGSWGIDFDLDDGIALVIVLVVLVLVLSALIYVVWIAPVLLAELMIDAALVGGLYGSVKGVQRTHWLLTALRKTAIPAAIVAILFVIAGVAMEAANPEAATIGQFLRGLE